MSFSTGLSLVDDFFREHGHYGLIREGEPQFKVLCATVQAGDLPPVEIGKIPHSMGVMKWMQVENQASLGSCQGHALTTSCELAIYRETRGTILQLNRMFAYRVSQKVDGINGDRGSTLEGGAKAAETYGLPLESLWPYSGEYPSLSSIPESCWTDAKNRKLRTHKTLENYDQVLQWLVHGIGGVEIGIGWNGSCTPDSQGRITRYRGGGGGHALALVDWTKDFVDSSGRPDIVMPNSWGKKWGLNGYAYISPSVIDWWCENETVIGHSDMDGPDIKPRKFNWDTDSFIP